MEASESDVGRSAKPHGVPPTGDPIILTVGHSNGDSSDFAAMLQRVGVEVVADVRSQPTSAYAPQFNEQALSDALHSYGIRLVPMGSELGGRPKGPGMYDNEGHVRYDRVAASGRFQDGLQRLVAGCKTYRVAMMCSEEDPTNCHRRLLIGRVLRTNGINVLHLRADGAMQTEEEVAALELIKYPERYQRTMFDPREEQWRSIQSVSEGTRPQNSSPS
jgi:uncharacterized protein (DUF488 family)